MFSFSLSISALSLFMWVSGVSVTVTSSFLANSFGEYYGLQVMFDSTSFLFLFVLMLVVSAIVLFEKEYMAGELYAKRFSIILYLFVGSMALLILSSNFMLALVGWDGLGVTSFLLICFYNTSVSWSSSLKTFLINRLGDGLLLVVVCYTYWFGASFYSSLVSPVSMSLGVVLTLALLTKSANFPFSSWLPAAMAAPTPVSALVHSSTLVTAGVYLLVRLFYLLPDVVIQGLVVLGLWTVFIASFAAVLEDDLKKVIAYSTLSQLGLMVYSVSQGYLNLTVFHLFTHALFKANMFICAGYVLLLNNHNQDLRTVSPAIPSWIIDISLWLSVINLNGGIYLSGFFSKDAILDTNLNLFSVFEVGVFVASLVFTVLYSFRMVMSYSISRVSSFSIAGISHSTVPLILSFCSLTLGWWAQNEMISVHEPSGEFKSWVLTYLVLFITFVCVAPYFRGGNFFANIGGLQFFNADSWLGLWSSGGSVSYDKIDKGLLSIPSKILQSTRSNGSVQSFNIANIVAVSLIITLMLIVL